MLENKEKAWNDRCLLLDIAVLFHVYFPNWQVSARLSHISFFLRMKNIGKTDCFREVAGPEGFEPSTSSRRPIAISYSCLRY